MEFDTIYTVKKETSKEDFLRKLLIELANSPDTPVDVVKAEFGEVEESVREAIVCRAKVETDYSASVGFDRVEKYWTKEKKYNSTTKEYYYEDVEKERTVTDWKPFSGHISGTKTAGAFNEDKSEFYDHDVIADVLESALDSSVVKGGKAQLTNSGLQNAKDTCAYFLEKEIKYPGDHQKDIKVTSEVTVQSIDCYILPYYQVEYTYNGKKYWASGFACGNPNIKAELPPNDVDVDKQAKESTQKSKKIMLGSWAAFAVTFVFACIMCAVGVHWLYVLPIATLVVAIIFHNKYDKEFNATISSLTSAIAIAKKEALEEALKANSYEKLSEKESSAFSAKSNSDNAKYQSSHKKGGVKVTGILCSIMTIILIIVCVISGKTAANKALHSPEQIQIVVVEKDEEYKEYVSGYLNGCYYIYFSYDISANEIGVSDMSIITYVYDKQTGEKLGSIKTTFSNMDLDAGATKTFSTEWSDNQPEKNNNTFFIEVYNTDFETLKFTYEFDYIHFEDGEYYRSED